MAGGTWTGLLQRQGVATEHPASGSCKISSSGINEGVDLGMKEVCSAKVSVYFIVFRLHRVGLLLVPARRNLPVPLHYHTANLDSWIGTL